jgi:hypothetical protein
MRNIFGIYTDAVPKANKPFGVAFRSFSSLCGAYYQASPYEPRLLVLTFMMTDLLPRTFLGGYRARWSRRIQDGGDEEIMGGLWRRRQRCGPATLCSPCSVRNLNAPSSVRNLNAPIAAWGAPSDDFPTLGAAAVKTSKKKAPAGSGSSGSSGGRLASTLAPTGTHFFRHLRAHPSQLFTIVLMVWCIQLG